MLVTVRTVTGDRPATVECETDLGQVVAHWRGGEAPTVGSEQHVEVDAVGSLVWADGPRIVAPHGESEHGQTLTGRIDGIDGDAVVVRIGGSVVLLEVEGDPPLGALGGTVSVRPSAFELWPIDL